MSKTPVPNLSKLSELKSRILFLLLALVIYRMGAFISVPGVNVDALSEILRQQDSSGGVSAMINMFSGGAFERMSIFMLGVMPYITASIIIQILSVVYPPLEQLKKEGQAGRRKMTQYTRYLTLLLAAVQGTAYAIALQNGSMGVASSVIMISGPLFVILAVVTWMTGTMFLMWLGEQISERGIGNGISMIIFASIVSGVPGGIAYLFEAARNDQMQIFTVILIVAIVLSVIWLVVYVERAQRRVAINYARKQQGRQSSSMAQATHLPLKLNMAGVIPAIFGSALLAFIYTISSFLQNIDITPESSTALKILQSIGHLGASSFGQGQLAQMVLFSFMIIFFCFFYTALQFNSKETAENLKRSGAFVPGIRPGIHTSQYLDKVLSRITFWGALYITGICLLPEILSNTLGLQFYFGGTSVLIAVVVVMDLIAQVQAHLMSQQYDSLMKKTNISSALASQRSPHI
ncbi:preprotein translocase membrane subunit SecY [Gammaproteobacteria bacterium]|nr:preprotein translocase membrane subunit SecY [Gammaproteobacteria bacterium]